MDMKQLRQRSGFRAEEIAVELEIAVSTVRNWEQGRTVPRLRSDQFALLCTLYQCSAQELDQAVKASIESSSA